MKKRIVLLLFILNALFVAFTDASAAKSQTWKVRPGDTLDIISTTLEIPKKKSMLSQRLK